MSALGGQVGGSYKLLFTRTTIPHRPSRVLSGRERARGGRAPEEINPSAEEATYKSAAALRPNSRNIIMTGNVKNGRKRIVNVWPGAVLTG